MDLSDEAIERTREPLEDTQRLILGIEAVCLKNLAHLRVVGGNLLLHVRGVGAWTLVTSGPRAGLYPEATDDDVDFSLSCEEWVLWELMTPDADHDVEGYVEDGYLDVEGDFGVFQRLLTLAQGGGNVVSLRNR